MIHRTIRTLDGRPFASAGFTDNRNGDVWAWMQETVAHECGVAPNQVGLDETDDGDVLTVDGVPVYRI